MDLFYFLILIINKINSHILYKNLLLFIKLIKSKIKLLFFFGIGINFIINFRVNIKPTN